MLSSELQHVPHFISQAYADSSYHLNFIPPVKFNFRRNPLMEVTRASAIIRMATFVSCARPASSGRRHNQFASQYPPSLDHKCSPRTLTGFFCLLFRKTSLSLLFDLHLHTDGTILNLLPGSKHVQYVARGHPLTIPAYQRRHFKNCMSVPILFSSPILNSERWTSSQDEHLLFFGDPTLHRHSVPIPNRRRLRSMTVQSQEKVYPSSHLR